MKQSILCILAAVLPTLLLVGCSPSEKQEPLTPIQVDLSQDYEDFDLQELNALNGGHVDVNYFAGDFDPKRPKGIKGVFSRRKIFNEEDALYALMSV